MTNGVTVGPVWRIKNTCQGRKWYVYRDGKFAAGFDRKWEAEDYVAQKLDEAAQP